MGKFFIVGALLGGGVTWAVMHFLVQSGLRGEDLKKHDEQIRIQAQVRGREEAAAELQREFEAKAKEAALRQKEEIDRREQRLKALADEKKELVLKLEGTQEDLAKAKKSIERLEQRCADLSKIASQTSIASRQLLKDRMAMRDTEIALWRTLGEAAAVVSQALVGWPDAERARKVGSEIPKLSKDYRALAGTVRTYIEQHSKALADELGDLGPHRAGVQEEDIRAIERLADAIQNAIRRMKVESLVVPAERNAWTDSEMFVEAGDVIQVRAEGQWRMADNWEAAGPDGWDGGSQYKVVQDARAGSLILKVGVSERAYPAYLGKPIVADASGRVAFRMNDNAVGDNGGELKVQVVSANPKSLREVRELWDKAAGRQK